MTTAVIDLPAGFREDQERLYSLIQSIADHLNTKVTIENVCMLRVKYDPDCSKIETILGEFASPGGITIKKTRKERKPKSIHLPGSTPKLERGIDPMGS